MDSGLQDKVAIITGAGSGIGRACALTFGRERTRVVCADINLNAARETCELLGSVNATKSVQVDVSDPDQVNAMIRAALDAFGTIDILVNCVGIFHATPIPELTPKQWDRMMAVNLKSVFLCSQAVLPTMKERRYGKIVSISSVAAQVGGVFAGADYSASKAGILTYTKSLAQQVGGYNINVNAICPGPTETPMADLWPADARDRALQRTPLGRLGRPEDIANVVLFLTSDLSSYIHGAHIDVNGGLYMD